MENPERVTYFAATDSRGKRIPFGIKEKDRSKHMYVIGKTGMGKSTMLENMAIQDIRNGEGLAFIDPHGGTADKLLEFVPKERINDVVYFAPFDMQRPIAFNVMEDVGYDKRHLVVSGLMATFKKIWVDAWSARMEYILSNTLLALLEYPDATLLSVNRMYTDKAFRKKVVDNVKDPVVKDFWVKEFANYGDRYTQEATPAIQNKIGQFTSNPLIRNIIGQPKSSFDIRDLMDRKKILIINLSKGQVGETNMRLLGSMITTRIFLGAMSRADLHHTAIDKLPNFYFFVDEFQNFANDTFSEILSESRKYKLNLVIAHQYIEQMEEQVRAAVFGNVGTTVAFRVGPFDAETLEVIFSPEFMKEDLVNLSFAQIYLTLMIDGVGSRPFSAITIPPIEPPPHTYKEEVIEASRRQFGAPREQIEAALMHELVDAVQTDPNEIAEKRSAPKRSPAQRLSSESARKTETREPYRGRQTEGASNESRGGNDRQSRSSHDNQEARSERPNRSEPKVKTADDLKAILRTMTAGNHTSSSDKVDSKSADSLKSTLAGIMQPQSPAKSTTQAQKTRPEPVHTEVSSSSEPFEVPEEKLKAIFREQ